MADNRHLIYHNSHDAFYRFPFGAVPAETSVTMRLTARVESPVTEVWLRAWVDGAEKLCPMTIARTGAAQAETALAETTTAETTPEETVKAAGEPVGDTYETEFDVGEKPGLIWYYFIIHTADGRDLFYGNNPDMLGGGGFEYAGDPASYQITVYDRNFHTPEWIRHGVIYQIFPDRFYQKRVRPLTQAEIEQKRPDYILHKNWDEIPVYKPDPRTGDIMNNDFFGGNLAGIAAKLPYLSELGVNALYLNPIFEAYSNHRYDTGNYRRIDALLGTERDFVSLCVQARKYGIRLILDGVFNHTGSDSLYFNREGRYRGLGAFQSTRSKYYSWYKFEQHPDLYDSWWGFKTLPNVNEADPGFRDYILDGEDSVIKHWLRQGASGWRLDVVDELPDEFVKKLRANAKEADREAVIIGEVWEDASNKVSYGVQREYFLGAELDSVMNYVFKKALLDFVVGRTDARRFDAEIRRLAENYPTECFYSLMNIVGGHDVPRVLTLLSDPPEGLTKNQKAMHRPTSRKRKLGIKRLKLVSLIQMTFPGAPCVYYGDEAGMTGFEDPFNRGTFPWDGIDADLHAWYRDVIALRNACPAFRTGTFETVRAGVGAPADTGAPADIAAPENIGVSALANSGGVYVYVRRISGGEDIFGNPVADSFALVAVNRDQAASETVEVNLSELGVPELYDALPLRPQTLRQKTSRPQTNSRPQTSNPREPAAAAAIASAADVTAADTVRFTLEPLGCRVFTYPALPPAAARRDADRPRPPLA